jgi:hypothetical protein
MFAEHLKNILKRKNTFVDIESFVTKYPNVSLQINQISEWDYVRSYYPTISGKLMDTFGKIKELGECIVNYVTDKKRFEIVGAELTGSDKIDNVDFMNCEVSEIWADTCAFVGCHLNKSRLENCSLESSVTTESKMAKTAVFGGEIENCYFIDGYMNGTMTGGVIRGGKVGPMGILSDETRILSTSDNFYSTELDDDDSDGKDAKKTPGISTDTVDVL